MKKKNNKVKHDTQTYDGIDMCCLVIFQRLPQNKRMQNAMYMNYMPLNMRFRVFCYWIHMCFYASLEFHILWAGDHNFGCGKLTMSLKSGKYVLARALSRKEATINGINDMQQQRAL